MKNINKNRMGRNIVLIGMPASGKSTIGKLLAQKINYEYYDADKYLEKKENVKISTLFSEKGEEYFRNLETKYLKELSQKNGIIISTGGGAVKREKNMQILGEKGIIVFLNRKIEDIAKENHEARPLLQNIDNIYKLYDERIELYNRYSDIIVENDGTLKEVTDKITEEIEKNSESIFEEEVVKYLVSEGYHIKQQWEVGAYRIDMVALFQDKKIAIECDGEKWNNTLENIRQDMERQNVLERCGWKFIRIRGSRYFKNPETVMKEVIEKLNQKGIYPENMEDREILIKERELMNKIKNRASEIIREWNESNNSSKDMRL